MQMFIILIFLTHLIQSCKTINPTEDLINKYKNPSQTLFPNILPKVLKDIKIDNVQKKDFYSLISMGHEINNYQDNESILQKTNKEKNTNEYRIKSKDSGNLNNKITEYYNKIFKKNKFKDKKILNHTSGKEIIKQKKKINNFFKKFSKKYKGWMIVIIALTSGIILALSLLSILSGAGFFIFIALMTGIASFRLFRKIKEEGSLCIKKNKAKKKQDKKNNKKSKEDHLAQNTHLLHKDPLDESGDKNKISSFTKRIHLEAKKNKKQKIKKRIELSIFISISLLIAILLALSLLGIIGAIISLVMIAILAGLAACRRIKLLFEGRL